MQQQPHFAAVKLFFRFGSSNKIVRLLPSSFSNFNNSNSLWSLADETLDVSLLEQTIINTLVSQPGQLLTPIAGVGGGVSLRIVGFGGSQDYFDSHQQESLDIRLNLPAKPIVKYLEENQDCLPSNFDKILFHASEDETKDLNTITNNEIHRHCNQKIAAERIGRINAEKMLRAGVVEKISDASTGYPTLVIGTMESPYLARRGTPRQGLLVPDSRSTVQLSQEIPIDMLLGLEGYSHMFILFIFHENTNLVKTILSSSSSADVDSNLQSRTASSKTGSTFTRRVQSFASKVLPPLLKGGSIGVFATRAPHRPNAIGMSLVRIVSVHPETRQVVVSGADLVNGTPIIDLKPWGPFDCPTCIHNVVDHAGIVDCSGSNINGSTPSTTLSSSPSSSSSSDRCYLFKTRIPDWVAHGLAHPYNLKIEWNPLAKQTLEKMVQENKSKFYKANESDVLIRAITQILSLDIRSVKQGRGEGPNGAKGHASQLIGDRIKNMSMMMKNQENNLVQSYEVEYDVFHINFTIRANTTDEDDSERRPWILIDSIALTSESGSS